ncbi:DUF4236 domain-containing protein [Pseudomonas syringae]|uniref:DUF4236 domain-containing protein n=1 Tax=Pseudomonas syringae TaxID=317 RepID=UPI000D8F36CE|nr:DUF4236 domain-containing protein [Pseudomonas syringae]PYD18362.1 DUF4236 domain-containing protein [Pseudomonas syringae pv. syringae]
MALRIRKSFKIAPGVRLNVSKSGVSTSIGGKGFTTNIGKKGTRVTAGIPGMGVSTSKLYKTARSNPNDPGSAAKPGVGSYVFAALIVIGVLWAVFRK